MRHDPDVSNRDKHPESGGGTVHWLSSLGLKLSIGAVGIPIPCKLGARKPPFPHHTIMLVIRDGGLL